VRVIADTQDRDRQGAVRHDARALPALGEMVAGRLAHLALSPEECGVLTAALAPGAPAGAGQLVAVGADVLLLAGARARAGDEALGEVFVNTAAAALGAVRAVADHEAHTARQLALTRAAKTLNESLDLETLLGRICEEAIGLLDADHAAAFRGTHASGFVVGGVAGLPPEFVGVPLEPGTGLAGQVVEHERPMLTNDYQQTTVVPPGSPFGRVQASLGVPFGWDDELRGVLSVGWERSHRVDAADLAVLETFTELAGVACRNASAHVTLALAAQTDALTGCLNHAALHQQLGRELERAARGAVEPPSLVLIDLDHFKQVNEEHGHLIGDEVLRRVGTALRSGIRPYDVAARYGGDEFALLVTAADEEAAGEVASRGAPHPPPRSPSSSRARAPARPPAWPPGRPASAPRSWWAGPIARSCMASRPSGAAACTRSRRCRRSGAAVASRARASRTCCARPRRLPPRASTWPSATSGCASARASWPSPTRSARGWPE